MNFSFAALLIFVAQLALAQNPADNTAASLSATVPEPSPPLSTQYPAVRPKPPDDPNKESSSFIGEAENLDPMRARQDSLKEDNEPVLEDIRQVIDAPAKPVEKKVEEVKAQEAKAQEVKAQEVKAQEVIESSTPPLPKKVVAKKATLKKKKAKIKTAKKTKPRTFVVRHDDEPDEAVERRFHQNYMNFNSIPTGIEEWSAATFGRSNEVYIVQKGDTLWTISETLFGDSLFWPKIWALNRQGILNPHFITPGMRVYFFPGSSEDLPTLSVGDTQQSLTANASGQNSLQDPSKPPATEGLETSMINSMNERPQPQLADAGVALIEGRATPLPPSLPLYRSDLYFNKKNRIEMIDLSEPEKLQIQQYVDIFLTDRLVLTDFKMSQKDNSDFGCKPGEIIKGVQFIRKTPTTEYTILDPLPRIKLEKKSELYAYKRVGTISYYGNDKLKIKDCSAPLSDKMVFVPTSVLSSLRTKKISDREPQIIGGADVENQMNFNLAGFIYLDMGMTEFELGQSFSVLSERLDSAVGQVKILDRFGSYALATIMKQENSIEVGDKIISK